MVPFNQQEMTISIKLYLNKVKWITLENQATIGAYRDSGLLIKFTTFLKPIEANNLAIESSGI